MLVTLAPQLESKDVVAHCKRFLPKVTDVSRCILRLKRRAGTFKVRHRLHAERARGGYAAYSQNVSVSWPDNQDWLKLAATLDASLRVRECLVSARHEWSYVATRHLLMSCPVWPQQVVLRSTYQSRCVVRCCSH